MGSDHSIIIGYKIDFIIIGEFAGKTCLCEKFVNGIFKPGLCATVGFDLLCKKVRINDKLYKIMIRGTSRYHKMREYYCSIYKNMACALIVYDITKRESFNNIYSWIEECKLNSKSIYIVLVGNRVDLEDQRQVPFEVGQALANKYGIDFYEISALTGENVEEIFINSVKEIEKRINQGYYKLNNDNLGIKPLFEINNKMNETNKVNKMKNVITRFKNRKKNGVH